MVRKSAIFVWHLGHHTHLNTTRDFIGCCLPYLCHMCCNLCEEDFQQMSQKYLFVIQMEKKQFKHLTQDPDYEIER